MNTWTSSVEDPEKHFLGNLLDDETSFSASPVGRSLTNRSSNIPSASVISSVGPINSSSKFWPEPPPPYTPTLDSSSSSWLGKSNSSLQFDVFSTAKIKEPSEWDTFLGTSNFFQQYQPSQQVDSTCSFSNSVELTPSSCFPQPFSFVVSKAKENDDKATPHSAPVVNKMPFSYRDVAARCEIPTTGRSSPQQPRKVIAGVESEQKVNSQTNQDTSLEHSQSIISNHKDSKPKLPEEFQKISRRRNGKDKKCLVDSVSVPLLDKPNVEEPTKYQVLENFVLATPKIVKVTNSTDLEDIASVKCKPVISTMRSRSTSVCPEEEGNNRLRKSESKKRVQVPSKKRNTRKKESEGLGKIIAITWAYIIFLWDHLQSIARWVTTLIVDVCSTMVDVFSFGFNCFLHNIGLTLRSYILAFTNYISDSVWRLRNLWHKSDYLSNEALGCEHNITISSSAVEEVFRISRIRNIDAYTILGLRADCSIEEIRKNHKKLSTVLNANYNAGRMHKVDGIEYARKLVSEAYSVLQTAENRMTYDFEVQMSNSESQVDFQHLFKALTDHVEMNNKSLKCDCGRRHSRTRTDIRPQDARYCRRCDTYHSARSSDIWVETSFFGLVWHYYTCADGVVYDITEWATCDSNYLKHLRPYSHNVQYRLCNPITCSERISGDVSEDKEGRSSAQASYRPPELKEEDRSRRAANRRQKRR